MCLQCDGYSYEQAMLDLDLTIRVHGWSLISVTESQPWSYTIGLTESYGHPELMMIGVDQNMQSGAIRRIVEPIVKTGRVDTAELADAGIELVEVHGDHLRGDWFGTWANRYGGTPGAGSFLQVVPPSDWFCPCHQHSMPRFDRPGPIRHGNRAERRRRR